MGIQNGKKDNINKDEYRFRLRKTQDVDAHKSR